MEMEYSTLWLLHWISCFKECDDILLRNSVVNKSVYLLTEYEMVCDVDINITRTTPLVRILGNLCSGEGAKELLKMEISLVGSVMKLLLQSQYPHLKQEVLWLIGNLLHHPSEEVKHLVQQTNFVNNLEPVLSDTLSKIC